jgi:hypothetical protein
MRICTGPRRFKAHGQLHVPYKWIRRRQLLVRSVRRALVPQRRQMNLLSTRYSTWRFHATLWRHMHPSSHTPIFRSGRSGYGQLRHTTRLIRTNGWFLRKARPFPVSSRRIETRRVWCLTSASLVSRLRYLQTLQYPQTDRKKD